MKSVSRWSKTKSLAPLDQQISNFFITERSSAVTRETVVETRGNCGTGVRWPEMSWRDRVIRPL